MSKSERWLLSEWAVALDRVTHHDEALAQHRFRTPFAEVDLLFRSRSKRLLTVVEVKTWQGDLWAEHLLARRQVQRLVRARAYIESRYEMPVRLLFAVVGNVELGHKDAIGYFEPPPSY